MVGQSEHGTPGVGLLCASVSPRPPVAMETKANHRHRIGRSIWFAFLDWIHLPTAGRNRNPTDSTNIKKKKPKTRQDTLHQRRKETSNRMTEARWIPQMNYARSYFWIKSTRTNWEQLFLLLKPIGMNDEVRAPVDKTSDDPSAIPSVLIRQRFSFVSAVGRPENKAPFFQLEPVLGAQKKPGNTLSNPIKSGNNPWNPVKPGKTQYHPVRNPVKPRKSHRIK